MSCLQKVTFNTSCNSLIYKTCEYTNIANKNDIFKQLREYELSEVFHRASDERKYDVLQLDKMNHNNVDVLDGNRALSIAEEVERAEQAPRIYSEGSLTTPDSNYSYYTL